MKYEKREGEHTYHYQPTKDWEITAIEAGTRSRFHVEGVNHCTTDRLFVQFSWGVDSVSDPRYFARPGLQVSENVAALLAKFGQIGGGNL